MDNQRKDDLQNLECIKTQLMFFQHHETGISFLKDRSHYLSIIAPAGNNIWIFGVVFRAY